MRRATSIIGSSNLPGDNVLGTVTLSFEDRFRRRKKMTDDSGMDFLLDLADAVQLEEGDALLLEDGSVIEVKAAEEEVLDIYCNNKAQTARIAWHIGNRHTPVQVLKDVNLRIIYDHVLREMVEGLGARTENKYAPFSPEQGAYAGAHSHDH